MKICVSTLLKLIIFLQMPLQIFMGSVPKGFDARAELASEAGVCTHVATTMTGIALNVSETSVLFHFSRGVEVK